MPDTHYILDGDVFRSRPEKTSDIDAVLLRGEMASRTFGGRPFTSFTEKQTSFVNVSLVVAELIFVGRCAAALSVPIAQRIRRTLVRPAFPSETVLRQWLRRFGRGRRLENVPATSEGTTTRKRSFLWLPKSATDRPKKEYELLSQNVYNIGMIPATYCDVYHSEAT